MAKNKQDNKNPDQQLFSQDVDPELVKKVDEYMQPDSVSVPVDTKEEKTIEPAEESPIDEVAAGGAPLLPTEKLPEVAKTDKTDDSEHEAIAEQPEDTTHSAVIEGETEANQEPSLEPELKLDDKATSDAVDDIAAADSDALLAAEDSAKQPVVAPNEKKGIFGKLKSGISGWWHTPWLRNSTIAVVFLGIAALAVVPTTRYAALNAAGVRASTSVKVIDEKTAQPLKNVTLSIAGVSSKSDIEGNVTVSNVKLGPQNMTIEKAGFATVSKKVTLGWGSNPQGETRLTPTGTQYTFTVSDYLSEKPVAKAEAISGEASARSNEKGEIVLTVPQSDADKVDVVITANNYRTENLSLPTDTKDVQKVILAPAKKHAFVSKRTGTLDLYTVDVDGKNEKMILSGTGRERPDAVALAIHPQKNVAALVSTRDNLKNKDGYLLNTLLVVDLETGETKRLADSERIQLIDWIGDRLVFVKITQGASEANPDRHKLMSYDLSSGSEKELATTNYFNDVVSAKGAIYYSPAVYKVNGTVGLYKIQPDGSGKKTVFEKEVWNILRTSYDKLNVSVGQDWYEVNLDTDAMMRAPNAPTVLKSRVYSDSPDKQKSLWVDERDGKGALVKYNIDSKEDAVLHSQSGLKNPVLWSDDAHAIFRVANGQETADYAISLNGGSPKKIKDVTNVAGVDRWYYY